MGCRQGVDAQIHQAAFQIPGDGLSITRRRIHQQDARAADRGKAFEELPFGNKQAALENGVGQTADQFDFKGMSVFVHVSQGVTQRFAQAPLDDGIVRDGRDGVGIDLAIQRLPRAAGVHPGRQAGELKGVALGK